MISIVGGIITAVAAPDWDSFNGDDADAIYASMIAASVSTCTYCSVYIFTIK